MPELKKGEVDLWKQMQEKVRLYAKCISLSKFRVTKVSILKIWKRTKNL